MPSAQLLDRHSRVGLAQKPDDLLFAIPLLHVQSPLVWDWTLNPSATQYGGDVDATHGDVERFEKLLGTTARDGSFHALTAQQCETVLAEIVQNGTLTRGSMFLQDIEISKWLVEGQPVKTKSMIHLHYGMNPRISTFLDFEAPEQFEFIKRVLSDLQFCKLNEKHLKLVKQRNRRLD